MLDLIVMAASGTYCYLAKGGLPNFKEAELPVKAGMVAFGGAAALRVLKLALGARAPLWRRRLMKHLKYLKKLPT